MKECHKCGKARIVRAGAWICADCDAQQSPPPVAGKPMRRQGLAWTTEDELIWLRDMLQKISPALLRAGYMRRHEWGDIDKNVIFKALDKALMWH